MVRIKCRGARGGEAGGGGGPAGAGGPAARCHLPSRERRPLHAGSTAANQHISLELSMEHVQEKHVSLI